MTAAYRGMTADRAITLLLRREHAVNERKAQGREAPYEFGGSSVSTTAKLVPGLNQLYVMHAIRLSPDLVVGRLHGKEFFINANLPKSAHARLTKLAPGAWKARYARKGRLVTTPKSLPERKGAWEGISKPDARNSKWRAHFMTTGDAGEAKRVLGALMRQSL